MVRPVVEAERAGRLHVPEHGAPVSGELALAVVPISEALFPGVPAETVVLAVQGWTTMIGLISLEVFGHWRATILEPELFFERAISDVATSVGLS
jgi:hypothetical protein